MSNKKDSFESRYFDRESLPLFLSKERFNELETELQDYIAQSSRMQYFLEENIDIHDIENVLNNAKYQMELAYQTIMNIETESNGNKDYSVVMQALEIGSFNADLALTMKEYYNHDYMKLRVADWKKNK